MIKKSKSITRCLSCFSSLRFLHFNENIVIQKGI